MSTSLSLKKPNCVFPGTHSHSGSSGKEIKLSRRQLLMRDIAAIQEILDTEEAPEAKITEYYQKRISLLIAKERRTKR